MSRQRSMFANRVEVGEGIIFIIGATQLMLWHLPVAEAEKMTASALAAEVGRAAKLYRVRRSDIWRAYHEAAGIPPATRTRKAQARHVPDRPPRRATGKAGYLTPRQLARRIGSEADWVAAYDGPPTRIINGKKRIPLYAIDEWKRAWNTCHLSGQTTPTKHPEEQR